MATNIKGDSGVSSAGHGATIITNPDPPRNLSEDNNQRSSDTLGLTWNTGQQGGRRLSTYSDGHSPIIDYRINMAVNGGSFSVLDSTTESSYLVTGLTAGTTYDFFIEARNEYGYSGDSDTLILLCAYIPEIPTDIATT